MNMGTEMLLCDAHILVVHKTLTLLQIWFGGLLNAILYNRNHLLIFSRNTNAIWVQTLHSKFSNLLLARNYGSLRYGTVCFGKWISVLRGLGVPSSG